MKNWSSLSTSNLHRRNNYQNYDKSYYSSNKSLQIYNQRQQHLNFNTKPLKLIHQPKFSISPTKTNTTQTSKTIIITNPQQLSTFNKLRREDIQFQQLIIKQKQLEYKLFVAENQIKQMTKQKNKLIKPLIILQDQINIWQGVIERNNKQIQYFCNQFCINMSQENIGLNIDDSNEYIQSNYINKIQSIIQQIDKQIIQAKNQIQIQNLNKARIQIQIFNLQQSLPNLFQQKIQKQKRKIRYKLLLKQEKQKMKIYAHQKLQLIYHLKKLQSIEESVNMIKTINQIHQNSIQQVSNGIVNLQKSKVKQQIKRRNQLQKELIKKMPIVKDDLMKIKKSNIILKDKYNKTNSRLQGLKSAELIISQKLEKQMEIINTRMVDVDLHDNDEWF